MSLLTVEYSNDTDPDALAHLVGLTVRITRQRVDMFDRRESIPAPADYVVLAVTDNGLLAARWDAETDAQDQAPQVLSYRTIRTVRVL